MSTGILKFFISEEKGKDVQKLTLENAATGEKTSFETLKEIYSALHAAVSQNETRIWIFDNGVAVGSLSLEQFKQVLEQSEKDGVKDEDVFKHLITNELLDKNHEIAFVDPRRKKVLILFLVAANLLAIAVTLIVLIFTKLV
ncbi:hypothetical protein [Mycoplasma simbae]|uniref:hypothetical protein n=1 Tax=Mycoplasma simbae TaxID=36744 RepID=UPI0004953A54|nr:hypothetical protein [Mycoplasma simbae]